MNKLKFTVIFLLVAAHCHELCVQCRGSSGKFFKLFARVFEILGCLSNLCLGHISFLLGLRIGAIPLQAASCIAQGIFCLFQILLLSFNLSSQHLHTRLHILLRVHQLRLLILGILLLYDVSWSEFASFVCAHWDLQHILHWDLCRRRGITSKLGGLAARIIRLWLHAWAVRDVCCHFSVFL